MDRIQKLKELQNQIYQLETEELNEIRAKILPFIREAKVKCTFTGSYSSLTLVFSNDETAKTLISFIQSKEDQGFNHFGCPLSELSEMHYDDGDIKIYFKFSGNFKSIKNKFKEEVKKLNIQIDFSEWKSSIRCNVSRLQSDLNEVELLEKELAI